MSIENNKTVTVIYYDEDDITLRHQVCSFPIKESGRVIIPLSFKQGKQIIAVCDGKVEILNLIGDRVLLAPQNSFFDTSDKKAYLAG